jgi:hypothetical protein
MPHTNIGGRSWANNYILVTGLPARSCLCAEALPVRLRPYDDGEKDAEAKDANRAQHVGTDEGLDGRPIDLVGYEGDHEGQGHHDRYEAKSSQTSSGSSSEVHECSKCLGESEGDE